MDQPDGGPVNAAGSTAPTEAIVQVPTLVNYLRDVVCLLIGGSEGELADELKKPQAEKDLLKFAEDTNVAVLSVSRPIKEKDEEEEKDDEAKEQENKHLPFVVSLEVAFSSPRFSSVTFIKRGLVLTQDKDLASQLRVITLSEGQPYETLHSFIHCAINPYLNAVVSYQKAGDKLGIKAVKKAVGDFELSLLHLQQDIDIPEITLVVNPTVKQVMQEAIDAGRKPSVEDFGSRADDATFLNALTKCVARWIREIQKVTRLERDPSSGTAMQEVSFWLNLERALLSIKDKRDSPEVTMTLEVLKLGKRFHATVGFDSDTGLQKALESVSNYNQLMKDFPLNGLLSATDTSAIRVAIVDIFSHMKRIRNTRYPVARALKLVQAISRDLTEQLLKVLAGSGLMQVNFSEFERIVKGCEKVFAAWEEEDDRFRNILRDLLKKKRDEAIKAFRRVPPEHKTLQDRLNELSTFRKQHEQLRTVIVRVLKTTSSDSDSDLMEAEDINAIQEVNLAYEDAKQADVLDLSETGIKTWEAAKRRYEERIDRVETRITSRLRDQLGTAKNANEMFRIFGKFNALFVRPKIRGAIREYQAQLIQRVKADIEKLHEKFKVQYNKTQNAQMSEVRDIPPVSGQIIWARQIDRQLTAYLRRVEDVLGRTWENHVEGRHLKEDGDSFRAKLDTQALFDKWSADVQARQLGVTGRIFDIDRTHGAEPKLFLTVNFHPQIITLSKEVRNLKWMGFRVPLVIVNKALQANHLYPFAISLKASIRTYQQTIDKLAPHKDLAQLVASYHKNIQTRITEGVGLRWESYRLEAFVQGLAEDVFAFQEKVDEMLVSSRVVEKAVAELDKCPMKFDSFADVIGRIQKVIDDLNLRSYVNLDHYVESIDARVEAKLTKRLSAALHNWSTSLLDYGKEVADWDQPEDEDAAGGADGAAAGRPEITPLVHEISIRNQVMYLNPPAERAREKLLEQLQMHLANITALPRIQSSRYQVGMDLSETEKSQQTYRSLLTKLPGGSAELLKTYGIVESYLSAMQQYVQVWLRYQALWDMQTDTILTRLGDDMSKWRDLLVEIKRARKTFDTSETSKSFGPITINYAQVQSRVNMKYDALHKDILGKFGAKLGSAITDFFGTVQKARNDLESQSIETASTSEAVNFITILQEHRRKVKKWSDDVESFHSGQKILERQRYAFPPEWVYVSNIESEWENFKEILARKNASIQGQVGTLQLKVAEEDRQLEKRVADLLSEWDRNKPVGGDINPDQAVNTLAIYESRFVRAKEEHDSLAKAKNALDLDFKVDDRLEPRLEELRDLKSSWSELSRIWANINEIKSVSWSAVQPRRIRASLDDLVNQMKNLPPRVRTYASYEHTLSTVKDYIKANAMLLQLKSDALKERHWKTLMRNLGVSWILSDLTLGQVWEADLVRNKKAIEDVMLVAQGENALEEFLKQIREDWSAYQLDLISYQSKTHLIRGWDALFDKVKEHINSLAQMKMSHHYKVFEEEANAWDDKLNRVNALFDVWIEVQRKWVYLEGIFSGSAEIKQMLPTETSRFESICSEFLALMSKVSKAPMVLDVIQIPNAQRSLERLADLLAKIQKALGDYLERERSSFPRFYFVGNEDLLDIIGNSKNVERLQKHFKNMFAGVQSILLNEEHTECLGLCSREGEEVVFRTPVQIKDVKINTWLLALEKEMKVTLAKLLAEAVEGIERFRLQGFELEGFLEWLDTYQAQLVVLAAQVSWSQSVEVALRAIESGGDKTKLEAVVTSIVNTLSGLADTVLLHQPPVRRKKLEHMITELVHQRDVTRELVAHRVSSVTDFRWQSVMRFYFNPKQPDVLEQLTIEMADAQFHYGFEYLGLIDKLVQTPLTDRCYLTMTQALKARQGGSPFGPAGTGKTESVKALGNQLGRFVLVFNCDETFDMLAMGRIFVGLCQVGAWGCFDEFNRLEERMLSAVSQKIQTIQLGLKEAKLRPPEKAKEDIFVDLVERDSVRKLRVHPDVGMFITMNPGYAGRSNLPDNLKKLFRNLAMTAPDRQLIAQVMLYSQGFRTAETLSRKINPLFVLCKEQLSDQSHYDFGLRSLKSVLVTAGNVKRDRLRELRTEAEQQGNVDEEAIAQKVNEQELLIQSVTQSMVPKLVADDIPLIKSLISDVFPGVEYIPNPMEELKSHVYQICEEKFLEASEDFITKIVQLYQVLNINHGVMLVGPSGSGKSAAWRTLFKALQRWEGRKAHAYVMDPKAISKDDLYGVLDNTTMDWQDGLLTRTIRNITQEFKGDGNDPRQWIIFDGDVDPEWVENLNSVLDDNKLLTLPNGERLSLPKNVRIIFEVQDLKNATLATVSRCGMVWFSEDVVTMDMCFKRYLNQLRNIGLESGERRKADQPLSPALQTQTDASGILAPFLSSSGLVGRTLEHAATLEHIMYYSHGRALNSLFSMLNQAIRKVVQYNETHPDFLMTPDALEQYLLKRLVYTLVWCIVGDSRSSVRTEFENYLRRSCTINLPPPGENIIDYEVQLPEGVWQPWKNKVPVKEIDTHRIAGTDVVVPTLDTVRHEDLLNTWLSDHLPIVLCGPPGSGKTMTLFAALRALPDFEVAGLNFSSHTTPELILKTFRQWCEFRQTPTKGLVLAPTQVNKWLVVFCDEINLPAMDKYSTVRVITFMRQMVERGGFWRTSDHKWVTLERIQFVGACNPPTDPGRVPLDHRFLRHVPVVYVDYPGAESLRMIYGTFNRALMRTQPALRAMAEPLTEAMVDFFSQTAEHFTADMQPHYIYSPREMTRWVKGVNEAVRRAPSCDGTGLVRMWAHEALRLFCDRLVHPHERQWTEEHIDQTAERNFGGTAADLKKALARPILFTDWLTQHYEAVEQEDLRKYVQKQMKSFCEDELDTELVLFDDVLEHVLRMDRTFRQSQGHMLLVGTSGVGKATLTRFVAWKNEMKYIRVNAYRGFTIDEFDKTLRELLKRAGPQDERIVMILDEGAIGDTAFLERMNTLLANGEVPGLYEGNDFSALMADCKEAAGKEGKSLSTDEELYKWFSKKVMLNLHVVLTMVPMENGLQGKTNTSPALFNRCVMDWYGDWPNNALFRVAEELSKRIDGLETMAYECPASFPSACPEISQAATLHMAVVNACMFVHHTARQAANRMRKREGRSTYITPRHYLDCLAQMVLVFMEKNMDLNEQRSHLQTGVTKIEETANKVGEMQESLKVKKEALAAAKIQAEQKQESVSNSKARSIQLGKETAEKAKVVAQEKTQANELLEEVNAFLREVGPKVEAAEALVSNLDEKSMKKLMNYPTPAPVLVLTCELILTLVGKNTNEWAKMKRFMLDQSFLPSLRGLKPKLDVDPYALKPVEKQFNALWAKILDDSNKYLKEKKMTVEGSDFEKVRTRVAKADPAAATLIEYADAIFGYGAAKADVGPKQLQANQLTQALRVKEEELEVANRTIAEEDLKVKALEAELEALKEQQIRLKIQAEDTEREVSVANDLLASLGDEQDRWSSSVGGFDKQMSTLVGDALLSGAFMGYLGYFDQNYRQGLMTKWKKHLKAAGIAFKPDLVLADYLSTPEQRLRWKQNSLPDDNICVENAILVTRSLPESAKAMAASGNEMYAAKRRKLQRYKRFPFVIDPAGQATDYLLKEYPDLAKFKTSFVRKGFEKNLENAVSYGYALLVEDGEEFDPMVSNLLNREYRREAGSKKVGLGPKAEVTLNDQFCLLMTTRNPLVELSQDVCSASSLVNFTVTPASLQAQCQSQALKAERPDVERQRGELLKAQGENRVKLLQLEKDLLHTLNQTSAEQLLKDDSVVKKMKDIKANAAEVAKAVSESEQVMATIEQQTAFYLPLAQRCSAIFFTLQQLSSISFLYVYSLQFFLDIFHYVLTEDPNLAALKDYTQRRDMISKDMFKVTFDRVAPGLLYVDRLPLALTFANLYLHGTPDEIPPEEFSFFMQGGRLVTGTTSFDSLVPELLTPETARVAQSLTETLPAAFGSLPGELGRDKPALADFLAAARPEEKPLPLTCLKGSTPTRSAFRLLLLLTVLRADRVLDFAHYLVDQVLGAGFMEFTEGAAGLWLTVEKQITANTSVLLCGVSGYDASTNVRDLKTQYNKQLTEVALGTGEAETESIRAIEQGSKSGSWVLLKNVHLAPKFLVTVEKMMLNLAPHPDFRLFLSSEISPKLPTNLIRGSRVFVYEPAAGIKHSLLRTVQGFPETMTAPPVERARMYFLLAWLHAVVQERLRYTPIGWSKKYEFGEPDLRSTMETIDTWMVMQAKGRNNLPLDQIPWVALQELIAQTIYGGRVDNETDNKLLKSFVRTYFVADSFKDNFVLVQADKQSGTAALHAPEGFKRERYIEWIATLKGQSPVWLGLPANAEQVLLAAQAHSLRGNMARLQLTSSEDDGLSADGADASGGAEALDAAPAWIAKLVESAREWLRVLPEKLTGMERTAESIKDPLFRFFERENTIGRKLLKRVRNDLAEVIRACTGETKQTNQIRAIMHDLSQGQVFGQWKKAYKVPNGVQASDWVADFAERLRQLEVAATNPNLRGMRVWLGGLFVPEAFFTATRQAVAQAHNWSLEKLQLELHLAGDEASAQPGPDDFVIKNMRVDGATGQGRTLKLVEEPFRTIGATILRWVNVEGKLPKLTEQDVELPLYLNTSRGDHILNVLFKAPAGTTDKDFYKRGIALICSSLTGM
eukprot:m.302295 g.302295  ORF g.302295 m.302295 type:complete len:4671 (+) comp22998_c0_seq14:51-14063(+)